MHMSFDDAALSRENPVRGKLYNEEMGRDLYKNCNIDYKGEDVTVKNFTKVMLKGKKG